jgi:hypothetical protein
MSKGNPAENGDALVGGTTDNGSGLDAEVGEYDELLAAIGRTREQDQRIAVHEAGHAVCARLLGHALGGATVDPGPGYEGRVWGERHVEAYAEVAAMPPMFGRRLLR